MRHWGKIVWGVAGAGLAIAAFVLVFKHFTAARKPSAVERTLANMATDVIVPIEAEQVSNPVPASDASLKKGEEVYAQNCALCHGTDGHARTQLGRDMYPPAMDLTSPHVQHWNDAELFWIVQNGVPLTGMPSWQSTLSAQDTWELVDYIHALPRLDAKQPAPQVAAASEAQQNEPEGKLIRYGRILYRQEGCFTCHRLDGSGGKVGPDLTVEGKRGRSEAWLIGHFKNPPAYSPGSIMPAFKNLTSSQLQALAVFLENQRGQKASKK